MDTFTADRLRTVIDQGAFASQCERAKQVFCASEYFQGLLAQDDGAADAALTERFYGCEARAAQLDPLARAVETVARAAGDRGPVVWMRTLASPANDQFWVSGIPQLGPDFQERVTHRPLDLRELWMQAVDVNSSLNKLVLAVHMERGHWCTVSISVEGHLRVTPWMGQPGSGTEVFDVNTHLRSSDELLGFEGADAYFTELLPRLVGYLEQTSQTIKSAG